MPTVNGTKNNDQFIADAASAIFNGNGGFDSVSYAGLSGGIVARFSSASEAIVSKPCAGGSTSTDTLNAISQLFGTNYADILYGSTASPAGGASIVLTGGGGNDTIYGFGAAWNVVDYGTSAAGITASLVTGTVLDGLGGTDTLVNVVNLRGSSFNDTITGSTGGAWTTLEGMAGNDTFYGLGLLANGVSYATAARVSSSISGRAPHGMAGAVPTPWSTCCASPARPTPTL